jgi:hypothetical protein
MPRIPGIAPGQQLLLEELAARRRAAQDDKRYRRQQMLADILGGVAQVGTTFGTQALSQAHQDRAAEATRAQETSERLGKESFTRGESALDRAAVTRAAQEDYERGLRFALLDARLNRMEAEPATPFTRDLEEAAMREALGQAGGPVGANYGAISERNRIAGILGKLGADVGDEDYRTALSQIQAPEADVADVMARVRPDLSGRLSALSRPPEVRELDLDPLAEGFETAVMAPYRAVRSLFSPAGPPRATGPMLPERFMDEPGRPARAPLPTPKYRGGGLIQPTGPVDLPAQPFKYATEPFPQPDVRAFTERAPRGPSRDLIDRAVMERARQSGPLPQSAGPRVGGALAPSPTPSGTPAQTRASLDDLHKQALVELATAGQEKVNIPGIQGQSPAQKEADLQLKLKRQMAEKKKKSRRGGIGRTIGSIAGPYIGAGLGTLIAPGIGTQVGYSLGGYAGGYGGEKTGRLF